MQRVATCIVLTSDSDAYRCPLGLRRWRSSGNRGRGFQVLLAEQGQTRREAQDPFAPRDASSQRAFALAVTIQVCRYRMLLLWLRWLDNFAVAILALLVETFGYLASKPVQPWCQTSVMASANTCAQPCRMESQASFKQARDPCKDTWESTSVSLAFSF